MKLRAQIVLTVFFPLYLATVLMTQISLTGFWTDVLFAILLSLLSLMFVFRNTTNNVWLGIALKGTNIICSLVVFGLLGLNLINPFTWDTFKLRSFYFQSVDGRLFNAYFKPVGAYGSGYGNFWITETPKYFPIIEWQVYRERAIDWDFNDDTFEGQPVDNYEVVRNYIKDEVIIKTP